MAFPFLKPQSQSQNPQSSLLSIQSHLNSLKSHLHSALQTLANRSNIAVPFALHSPLQTAVAGSPPWACLSPSVGVAKGLDVDQRLAGVPVYALSNSAEEFVLVSGRRTGKNLGLFCFRREDAESLLEEMKSVNADMRKGSKVVELALSKVCQLKVDGVAFRFIPDSSEVANAIREKEKFGEQIDGFSGVPVFQSRSLVLSSHNKRYRPFFFKKEDLDNSLSKAATQQRQLNPAMRRGDIQVLVLEDIIKSLTETKSSTWDDVVFIPPGLKLSGDLRQIADK